MSPTPPLPGGAAFQLCGKACSCLYDHGLEEDDQEELQCSFSVGHSGLCRGYCTRCEEAAADREDRDDLDETEWSCAPYCHACGDDLALPEMQCANHNCAECIKVRDTCALCKPGCCRWPAISSHLDPQHPALEVCTEPECEQCAMRDCPTGEPLHYDDDGCPACYFAEQARGGT